jgi:hypothetical protein
LESLIEKLLSVVGAEMTGMSFGYIHGLSGVFDWLLTASKTSKSGNGNKLLDAAHVDITAVVVISYARTCLIIVLVRRVSSKIVANEESKGS